MLYNRKITAQENYGEHSYRDKYFGKKSSTVKISTGANTFFFDWVHENYSSSCQIFCFENENKKIVLGIFQANVE